MDVIFNFHKAHYILDEYIMGGEVQEPSIKAVLKVIGLAEEAEREEMSQDRKLF